MIRALLIGAAGWAAFSFSLVGAFALGRLRRPRPTVAEPVGFCCPDTADELIALTS